MSDRPSAELRRRVIERAQDRCEYCLIHQDDAVARHQIDHVIADKHGGPTTTENLALSCVLCNLRKSSDLSSVNPESGQITPLYNPRAHRWNEHFRIVGVEILGTTPEGKTTAHFLQFNSSSRLAERRELALTGGFPPALS